MWWKICIAQNMGWEQAGCKYLFTLQQGLWQSYSCSDWCGYTTLQHRNTAVDKQQGLIFVQHTTAASPISYTPQWTESDRILSLDFETENKKKTNELIADKFQKLRSDPVFSFLMWPKWLQGKVSWYVRYRIFFWFSHCFLEDRLPL